MIDESDPQRDLVYLAEDRALVGGRRFRRFADVESFVAAVTIDPWWESDLAPRWGVIAPLHVVVGRRSRTASASVAEFIRPVIWLRDGDWTAAIVLHELAHLVARDPESHGPVFCGVFRDLVARHLGFHASVALETEFHAAGVRVRSPCRV